jgi:hypothetical protein
MKEYHLHRTPLPDGAEQLFIISATRDDKNQSITVEEIFVVTSIGNKEVKSRIEIEGLVNKIAMTPGGNVPVENYDKLYEMLDSLIPEKEQLRNQVELYQHTFNPKDPITDNLIFAAEMAASCHSTDFDTIVEELLSANNTHNK